MKISRVSLIILTIGCILAYLMGSMSPYNMSDAVFCLISVVIGMVMYFNYQQHSPLKNAWVKPTNLLLLGLLIVNFQYVFDLILGFKTLDDFVRPDAVYKSCYVSAIGINAFLVGATYPNNKQIFTKSEETDNLRFNITFLVILQFLFLVLWMYTVNIVTLMLGLQYGTGEGSSNIFEGFLNNTNYVLLTCVAINSRDAGVKDLKGFLRQNSLISWVCIAVYMLIRLVSGDRGPFIYTAFAIFFSFIFATKYRIKLSTVVIVALVGSIMISLVGMARKNVTSGSFLERIGSSFSEFTSLKGRFSDRTILSSTEELAWSIRCNLIAIDEVDNGGEPLHNGKYQMYQLLNCIPFMPSFMANTLHLPPKEVSSDYFLTDVYFGDYYMSGQIGTTCIADFYLDGGIIGVLIGMLVMGLFFRKVDSVICLQSCVPVIVLVVSLLFASKCFYVPRSTFLTPIKPIVVVLVIYYINLILFNRGGKRIR